MLLHFLQNEMFNVCNPFKKRFVLSREIPYEFWPQIINLKMGEEGAEFTGNSACKKEPEFLNGAPDPPCVVWPGRIPSSNFQAEEKGGRPSHTGR